MWTVVQYVLFFLNSEPVSLSFSVMVILIACRGNVKFKPN
jgi:hypothetical protein